MTSEITIEFGALAKPVGEQITEQGLVIDEDEADRFELIAQAIVILHLHDIIPDSVSDNARKKLMKRITKAVHS